MIRRGIERLVRGVTSHNRIVIVVMLLLTAGVTVGIADLDTESEAGADAEDFQDVPEIQKQEYIEERYDDGSDDEDVSYSTVYVRDEDGNVLSKAALLDSLRYQQRVLENESVANALTDDGGLVGVSNLVAAQLAGDRNADLETQIAAVEDATDEEVAEAVRATLTEDSEALRFVSSEYEPGTATATDRRMIAAFDADEPAADGATAGPPSDAQRALYEEAADRDDPEYFTLGEHAWADANDQFFTNTATLILPAALALILGVLAFTYRDPIDVVVGMIGVVVSVLWMFGILGWLGVSAGTTVLIGPVLITGLCIDYGFHVFMRYREERGPEDGIREPMFRSVRSVAIAFGLVTITAAIGFLSNLANPLAEIQNLGVGITLGIASTFVIFVTLVPALKVSADGIVERFGFDRRKRPLGHGAYLRRLFESTVTLARRAAPIVIVVALVAGASGAAAWTALDEESFQEQTDEAAEWKQNLPGPLAWEVPETQRNDRYVQERYRSPNDEFSQSQLLIEGDVTADGTLDRVDDGVRTAEDEGIVFEQPGAGSVVSPITVMQAAAERDEAFAETLADADADGDGIPDRDLEEVYDHLYEVDPEGASAVIERSDGKYRSLRVIVPVDGSATFDDRADAVRTAASAIEDGDGAKDVDGTGDGDIEATAVGSATLNAAVTSELTDGILRTMLVALTAVLVALMIAYRAAEGSATLGFVTVVPIALVTGLVIGAMYVLEVPLTLLTSLLMSVVIGVGIDYNIHISDRFAQELDRGRTAVEALRVALTGTGGALLGSTLTSVGAFATLLLHPNPQFQSFATMIVLAMGTSFVVSVFVLPSMLLVWARRVHEVPSSGPRDAPAAATDD